MNSILWHHLPDRYRMMRSTGVWSSGDSCVRRFAERPPLSFLGPTQTLRRQTLPLCCRMTRRIREMVARGQQDFEANLNAHQESLWHDWDAALPDHLYHYTALTGMQGILEAGVCWATDIRHMND